MTALYPSSTGAAEPCWSYDFVQDRTQDGRPYRILVIIDRVHQEALMLRVDRRLNSTDVVVL